MNIAALKGGLENITTFICMIYHGYTKAVMERNKVYFLIYCQEFDILILYLVLFTKHGGFEHDKLKN